MKNNLLNRIEINPEIYRGKPIIKGTRVSLEIILKSLSQGMNYKEMCDGYNITEDDIKAAILYAEKLLENEIIIA